MASNIDPSYPIDQQRVEKAKIRQQFQAAKEEIEKLQKQTKYAWLLASGVISL